MKKDEICGKHAIDGESNCDCLDIDTSEYGKQNKEINRLKEIIRGYEKMATTGVWVETEKYIELVKRSGLN